MEEEHVLCTETAPMLKPTTKSLALELGRKQVPLSTWKGTPP